MLPSSRLGNTGAVLTATFVRHRGGRDHIYVTRADGTEVHWQFPASGDGLPHDLVHLVVESGLEMRDGFWGLIDRGADVAVVDNEPTLVRGGRPLVEDTAFDGDGLRAAEAAVGGLGPPGDGVQRGYVIPAAYVPPELAAVRLRLLDLQRDWAALPDRGSITVSFG